MLIAYKLNCSGNKNFTLKINPSKIVGDHYGLGKGYVIKKENLLDDDAAGNYTSNDDFMEFIHKSIFVPVGKVLNIEEINVEKEKPEDRTMTGLCPR